MLAGPTAVGKGTVAAEIREHHPEIWISVSATVSRRNASATASRSGAGNVRIPDGSVTPPSFQIASRICRAR